MNSLSSKSASNALLFKHRVNNAGGLSNNVSGQSKKQRGQERRSKRVKPVNIQAPLRSDATPSIVSNRFDQFDIKSLQRDHGKAMLISKDTLLDLERELYRGEGMSALVEFNQALTNLNADNWREKLFPIFKEWSYNLESFNPAFTAIILQVQKSIGQSDYFRRDAALKNLIQPLAGEYGMHNNQPQGETHRQLFVNFYESLFSESIMKLLNSPLQPVASESLFSKMINDIESGGMISRDSVEKATYALGYNLAIEYLADYEKTWMLESFRTLDKEIFSKIQLQLDWLFMEVHAVDEKEHAAIGHESVLSYVMEKDVEILRKAISDHDRDFAIFYRSLTAMLR